MEHYDDCIINSTCKFCNLISKIHANRLSRGQRGGVEAEGWKRVVFALCVVCCTIGFLPRTLQFHEWTTMWNIFLTYWVPAVIVFSISSAINEKKIGRNSCVFLQCAAVNLFLFI